MIDIGCDYFWIGQKETGDWEISHRIPALYKLPPGSAQALLFISTLPHHIVRAMLTLAGSITQCVGQQPLRLCPLPALEVA